MSEYENDGDDSWCKCPKCGSTNLAGLMNSFWVELEEDGLTPTRQFSEHESSTEVGERRMCSDCKHVWGDAESDLNNAIDAAVSKLVGPEDQLAAIIRDRDELLRKACSYAEYQAKQKRCEPWSIIGAIFGHGSGVASAIYEVYRSKK